MKKYNEKMIVRNGKMVYAISLEDNNEKHSDRTHIVIENGKVYFTDSWMSNTAAYDFNDESHRIAKEIFVSELQTDIKRRILELKQLEEIFESLDLKECLGNVISDNSKKLLDIKKITNGIKNKLKGDE